MSKSNGRPPVLNTTSFMNLVHEYYDFKHICENSVKHLPSYYDANFYFRGSIQHSSCSSSDGKNFTETVSEHDHIEEEYVLKILNSFRTPYSMAVGLSALWTHLQMKGLDYTSQIVNKQGKTVTMLTAQELQLFETGNSQITELKGNEVFCMRVMRFVAGEVFDEVDKRHLTPRLMYDVGAFLGNVDTALKVRQTQ